MKHGRGAYAKGCRCDECRAAQRDYMREYQRSRRVPRTATCPGCAQEFPASGRRLWCSAACKSLAEGRRAARRMHGGKGPRQRRAEALLVKAHLGSRSEWAWISGVCTECGWAFTRHGEASPYCSKRCSGKAAARRRRAREAGAKIGRVRRIAIHERDEWTCHICGDPVNRDAHVPELDAPVLDHVVALAAGGAHEEDNLKTAHFYCNSVKRDLALEDVA